MVNVLKLPGSLLQSLKLIMCTPLANLSLRGVLVWLVAHTRQSLLPPLSWC